MDRKDLKQIMLATNNVDTTKTLDYKKGFEHGMKISAGLLEELDEPQITDEQAWNKVAEAYPESPQSLRNTLDNAVFGKVGEPKKHIMPKFFDKWAKLVVEEHDKFHAISLIGRAGWGYGVDYELSENRSPSETKELLNWLVEDVGSPNKMKAVEALLYGYEVEKEPSYCVKVGKGYFSGFDETKVTYVLDDAPGSLDRRVTYKDKDEAEMDAAQIGGIVEEVGQ